jgi:hypothetical protein
MIRSPGLATAARFECAERQRLLPSLVLRGLVDAQEAEDETECWHLIATAFETGNTLEHTISASPGPCMSWTEIAAALERATKSRADACAKRPDDEALAARRDAVAAIVAIVGPRARFWCNLNAAIRATTERPETRAA